MSAVAQSVTETRGAGAPARDAAGFGVYVHWPFCLSKCPYCDFNSHVRQHFEERRFCAALAAELEHYAAQTGSRVVTSLFFGGGTPSLMAPESVAAIIARVKALVAHRCRSRDHARGQSQLRSKPAASPATPRRG